MTGIKRMGAPAIHEGSFTNSQDPTINATTSTTAMKHTMNAKTRKRKQRQADNDLRQVALKQKVVASWLLANEYEFFTTRGERFLRNRLCWDQHLSKLRKESGAFETFYRMKENAFDVLLQLICPKLCMDHNRYGNQAILPEIYLHCVIRFLAGGSYLDIRDKAEISTPSFYRIIWKAVDAILEVADLSLNLPESELEHKFAADQFAALSTNKSRHPPLFTGCVGALDGMLQRIRTPDRRDTNTSRNFFSGHYATMGVNCQAMCDHLCRFTYMGSISPGGANDIRAYQSSKIKGWVDRLPSRYYIVADNAYIVSEHLLTPYSGVHKNNEHKDAFNFYLSHQN